jgi:hypothetical protein
MKVNFELLQQLLPELTEFANSQRFPEQLFSVNGFDEATAVVEQLRGIRFPAYCSKKPATAISATYPASATTAP